MYLLASWIAFVNCLFKSLGLFSIILSSYFIDFLEFFKCSESKPFVSFKYLNYLLLLCSSSLHGVFWWLEILKFNVVKSLTFSFMSFKKTPFMSFSEIKLSSCIPSKCLVLCLSHLNLQFTHQIITWHTLNILQFYLNYTLMKLKKKSKIYL